MANEYRTTWTGLEVLSTGDSSAQVSWFGLEILNSGDSVAQVTWMGVEVLRSLDSIVLAGDSGDVSILW